MRAIKFRGKGAKKYQIGKLEGEGPVAGEKTRKKTFSFQKKKENAKKKGAGGGGGSTGGAYQNVPFRRGR